MRISNLVRTGEGSAPEGASFPRSLGNRVPISLASSEAGDDRGAGRGQTRRRILVVDDEPSIRTLVTKFLLRSGYDVDHAEDGGAAIERLKHNQYDAVVTDLMMPNIDGFGVVRWIERERPALLPHTIILTAYTRVAETTLNRSCTLLGKPFDLIELRELIKSFFTTQPPS